MRDPSERSAEAAGHVQVDAGTPGAALTCCVNPNNPTGGYRPLPEMQQYIEENCEDGSHVIVDESMQPWVGPEWRNDSLISVGDWAAELEESRGISVFVMHSWTKLWACPGVRLGSVVAPSATTLKRVKAKQVPWSVNLMAIDFTSAVSLTAGLVMQLCAQDRSLMDRTVSVSAGGKRHRVP